MSGDLDSARRFVMMVGRRMAVAGFSDSAVATPASFRLRCGDAGLFQTPLWRGCSDAGLLLRQRRRRRARLELAHLAISSFVSSSASPRPAVRPPLFSVSASASHQSRADSAHASRTLLPSRTFTARPICSLPLILVGVQGLHGARRRFRALPCLGESSRLSSDYMYD